MSDTPRTDAHIDGLRRDPEVSGCDRTLDFARQLELELNAANERIQSLIEERDRANRLAEWKWNLRDEFESLLGTDKIEEGIEAVKELKRRIQRLEEALDTLTLVVGLTPIVGNKYALQEAMDMARAELKAKEAKP